ncbi:ankyrin [Aaosphaeria arxii CBS 175.79]|uniref:Ankyrin n=1 Tax=Aaosphaeria arxii CBS 175.79 TaxID=1450172 RepID=A0A6A5XDR9_9PLEO|nr:ankyrin [Aaosphaeria arxii CBS 175.79]KAF2011039.1 ankyrin [Aaosphaeria arxii CBS 175.79]
MSKHKPQADHITTTKTANVNPNSLPGLPAELLLTIADCLDSGLDRPYSGLDDINRLAQTNIYLYSVLNDYIYRFEIKHNNGLALLWAAENDREATLLRMLSLGADVNTTEGPNMIWAHWTPLLYAAKENHPSIVKILLSRPDIDVNARLPESQQTALSIASQEGWTNVVSLLIAHPSTDLEATEGKHGQTPLSLAAERGYDDIVALFLNNTTADPDPPSTSTGQTPLSYAVHHGHLDVVSLLLASPFVDPHSKDTQFGCTPLMWASRCGYVPIVTLLLSAPGLEIDYADTDRMLRRPPPGRPLPPRRRRRPKCPREQNLRHRVADRSMERAFPPRQAPPRKWRRRPRQSVILRHGARGGGEGEHGGECQGEKDAG